MAALSAATVGRVEATTGVGADEAGVVGGDTEGSVGVASADEIPAAGVPSGAGVIARDAAACVRVERGAPVDARVHRHGVAGARAQGEERDDGYFL